MNPSMQNKVKSLAVGTAMESNRFSAVVLKLELASGEFLLTHWDRSTAERLLKALGEYMLYLHSKKISMDSAAAEKIIRQNAPALDQAEIEDPSTSNSVSNIKGRVEADQLLQLSIHFQQTADAAEIVIAPEYVRPLNDHVGSILDSFDSSGNLIPPSETVH